MKCERDERTPYHACIAVKYNVDPGMNSREETKEYIGTVDDRAVGHEEVL
jgi:hypothetical protein